jgi:cbb3-type cytochrome oxidase subunit 3
MREAGTIVVLVLLSITVWYIAYSFKCAYLYYCR